MRTRFAPSPTGYLHRGHALAAQQAFGAGPCLLRIEDIDHTRCKPEYTDGIFEDLHWLGHDWPEPVRQQSAHYAAYGNVVAQLIERGLAYPCTLTRREIAGGAVPAPGDFQKKDVINTLITAANTPSSALPFAIRLNLAASLRKVSDQSLTFRDYRPIKQGEPSEQGEPIALSDIAALASQYDARTSLIHQTDPIIARRDIGCSYHIAVTHDDEIQGVSHVVRGADFIDQTPLQVLIQRLMGWHTPIYHHHALLLDAEGEKLAKKRQSETIRSLREAGVRADAILG